MYTKIKYRIKNMRTGFLYTKRYDTRLEAMLELNNYPSSYDLDNCKLIKEREN